MGWKYPLLTRNTARKLALIFSLEVVLITAALVVVIHSTWRIERWKLQNGSDLEWLLGLVRIWGSANCDAVQAPRFYAICNTVFKQAHGTVKEVRDYICNLRTAQLKIEPEYVEDARMYSYFCQNVDRIYLVSLVSLILFILAAVACGLVFFLVLRLAYKQFKPTHRKYYWLSFLVQLLTCICFLVVLVTYSMTADKVLPGLFHGIIEDDPAGPMIQRIPGGGTFGVGFYMTIVLLILDLLTTVLILFWVPISTEETQLVKSARGKKKKGEKARLLQGEERSPSTTTSFWAYMPEVFQPDVYVAEYNAPQLVG